MNSIFKCCNLIIIPQFSAISNFCCCCCFTVINFYTNIYYSHWFGRILKFLFITVWEDNIESYLAQNDNYSEFILQGYEKLISVDGLHQLHILIFFLAFFHVLFSAITMTLVKLKVWTCSFLALFLVLCYPFTSNCLDWLFALLENNIMVMNKLEILCLNLGRQACWQTYLCPWPLMWCIKWN